MANPIVQYFKDTRSELNHVAWPTQKQTVIFTVLVSAISLGVAAYLGTFDYIFTTALGDVVNAGSNSSSGLQVTQQPAASASSSTQTTQTPAASGPTFNITGASSTNQ